MAELSLFTSQPDMSGDRESLYLNTKDSKSYKCEPLVIISVLDHHKRRTEKQQRVTGTLLGVEDRPGEVTITNCFPLIHHEEGDVVRIDNAFCTDMQRLHSYMNPKEKIVGWYVTGDEMDYNTAQVHNVHRQYVANPVCLLVDTVMKSDKLIVKAYHGTRICAPDDQVEGEGEEKKQRDYAGYRPSDGALVERYEEVPLSLTASQAEKIAIDVSISGHPDNKDEFDSPSSIIPDIDSLQVALANLMRDVQDIDAYVDKVLDGTIEGDPAIGREIVHALAAIPHVDGKLFDKMFSRNIQNLLMVVYLSSLTQTQLAIANKIGEVL